MLSYVLTRGAGQTPLLQTDVDYEPLVLAGGSARADADACAGLPPRAQPLVHGPVVPGAGVIGPPGQSSRPCQMADTNQADHATLAERRRNASQSQDRKRPTPWLQWRNLSG